MIMNKSAKYSEDDLKNLRIEVTDILNSYKYSQISRDMLERLNAELCTCFSNIIPGNRIETTVYVDREKQEIKIAPLNEESLVLFEEIFT